MSASQTLMSQSAPPETIFLPSGLKAAAVTARVWPVKVRTSAPVLASHSLSVLSPAHDRIYLPSGL